MLTNTLIQTFSSLYRHSKPKNLHQRLKYYGRMPDKFKRVTLMRPPNLKDPDLVFPIRIPIRYRHIFHLKKQLIVENTSKINWGTLQPNQILLGFEHVEYLSFKETVEGLKYLSNIQGQQKYNWNEHEWVKNALDKVKKNIAQIKNKDIMTFYSMLKKLNYTDQQFWKLYYAKIEQKIYDLHPSQFSTIFCKYYNRFEQVFSADARQNFNKLMENRLREFSPKAIVQVFEYYLQDKKLDTYWLQNVFAGLFKHNQYIYQPAELAKIFRTLMIIGHEENPRLYDNLYWRLQNYNYKTLQQIQLMEEVLGEVKEIFTSHRVDNRLKVLQSKKQGVLQKLKLKNKKTIQQMVKDDLRYFLEKRKLKQQDKGTQTN